MKRARLDHLQRTAARRRPGYLAACLRLGAPSADGQWIEFTNEAHAQLRRDFAVDGRAPSVPVRRGLGDLVHQIAGPIGRAIKWPCLKGDGTTDLKPNSPCAKAKRALNKIKV